MLAYAVGGIFPDPPRRHFWIDRSGRAEPFAMADQKPLWCPRLSPDRTSVAWSGNGASKGIWVQDLRRNTLVPLVTDGYSSFQVWTPDGSRVAFAWSKAGPQNVWLKGSDGGGEMRRLTTSALGQTTGSMTPDGKYLALVESNLMSSYDIMVVQMSDGKVIPFSAGPSAEGWPEFSPDGRWLAYASNESGRFEVYVRAFPESGRRLAVSNQGGIAPLWSRDGKELFYWNPDYTQLLKVDVAHGKEISVTLPKVLFSFQAGWSTPVRSYEISADDRRFLVRERPKYTPVEVMQLPLVHDWFEELKRLIPIK